VGLAPHPAVGGPPGGNYPLSSLFAAVASADPHAHFNSTIASDQAKAAAAAKVKQACLPCKKAHTACDEYGRELSSSHRFFSHLFLSRNLIDNYNYIIN
jgi:hypothetical protein